MVASSNTDFGTEITVEGSGAANVTEDMGSSDSPTTADAYDKPQDSSDDVFVAKVVRNRVFLPVS